MVQATHKPARNSGRPANAEDIPLTERVYHEFKREIITGVLEPGRPLTEAFLAKRFGASHTPIRETCARLKGEALLETIPNKGYFVAPITLRGVQELFELRSVLEELTVVKACGMSNPELMARLESLAKVHHARGNRKSYMKYLNANFEFHVGLAQLAGNQRATRVVADIMNQLARAGYASLAYEDDTSLAVKQHGQILRAIKNGQVEAGKEAIRVHIEHSQEAMLRTFWE